MIQAVYVYMQKLKFKDLITKKDAVAMNSITLIIKHVRNVIRPAKHALVRLVQIAALVIEEPISMRVQKVLTTNTAIHVIQKQCIMEHQAIV